MMSTKKRNLPAWMKSIQKQTKQTKLAGHDPDTQETNGVCETDTTRAANCNQVEVTTPIHRSAAQVISDSMPLLESPDKVTYVYQDADCACVCEEILASLEGQTKDTKVPVGFDMEWPVSFQKHKQDKTALIQMCFVETDGNNNKYHCYLFQVCGMTTFPNQLKKLVCDERVILVGLNIESDLWKLERDFDIRVKPLIDRGSVVDVGRLANAKLKSFERWDLNGLCRNQLERRLDKGCDIRQGDWTRIPLSQLQRDYSAIDAYAGLLLYEKLSRM